MLLSTTKTEQVPTMTQQPEPPQELEDFELWCTRRGLVDATRHAYTGNPAVWKAERLEWALAHGWPGGADAFFACEAEAEDEPWDASEI